MRICVYIYIHCDVARKFCNYLGDEIVRLPGLGLDTRLGVHSVGCVEFRACTILGSPQEERGKVRAEKP